MSDGKPMMNDEKVDTEKRLLADLKAAEYTRDDMTRAYNETYQRAHRLNEVLGQAWEEVMRLEALGTRIKGSDLLRLRSLLAQTPGASPANPDPVPAIPEEGEGLRGALTELVEAWGAAELPSGDFIGARRFGAALKAARAKLQAPAGDGEAERG